MGDVRVKKSELKRSHSSVEAGMPEYKMMAYPRGLALIIEIEEFQNQIASRRHGSHVDILNLKKLFEQLHFKIDHHQNLNRMDFLKQLDIFAAAPEHREADMMVLVILSMEGIVQSSLLMVESSTQKTSIVNSIIVTVQLCLENPSFS